MVNVDRWALGRARRWRRGVLLMLAALSASGASAHDTWFETAGRTSGAVLLWLGTGDRYPRHEEPVSPRAIDRAGCMSAGAQSVPLEPMRIGRRQLLLRSPEVDADRFSCWAQLLPAEITLGPEAVVRYFAEIRAPAALREQWERMNQSGVPFRERYTKSARIDGARPGAAALPLRLDVVRLRPEGVPQVGAELVFELRKNGRPLAAQPLELLHGGGAVSEWLATDAQGLLRLRVAHPGRWLLRGVELRAPAAPGAMWESEFVTYAFDVVSP